MSPQMIPQARDVGAPPRVCKSRVVRSRAHGKSKRGHTSLCARLKSELEASLCHLSWPGSSCQAPGVGGRLWRLGCASVSCAVRAPRPRAARSWRACPNAPRCQRVSCAVLHADMQVLPRSSVRRHANVLDMFMQKPAHLERVANYQSVRRKSESTYVGCSSDCAASVQPDGGRVACPMTLVDPPPSEMWVCQVPALLSALARPWQSSAASTSVEFTQALLARVELMTWSREHPDSADTCWCPFAYASRLGIP